MLNIKEIKIVAEEIIKATSHIFEDVEVVIVDKAGNYLSFDENYKDRKGTNEWTPYIEAIINRKEIVIIDNPGLSEWCKGCNNEGNCPQTLEISVPFNINDNFLGYMSLITFTIEKKIEFLNKKDEVINFINSMIRLLGSAAKYHITHQRVSQMFNELNIIVNTMNAAVFKCDLNGILQYCNADFCKMTGITTYESGKLHINELVRSKIIENAITNQEVINNQESILFINENMERSFVESKAITNERGSIIEFIFFLRSAGYISDILSGRHSTYNAQTIDTIIGSSKPMSDLKTNIINFSNSISTVLIRGETGTGKELVARAMHNLSTRSKKSFVTINCAAIPENLLESELFGYEEGAFTGSSKGGKAGLFEIANNGTIFLDEIGDMPIHLQSKILRVLQEKNVIRLGGHTPIELNIRIIAATHQNLEILIEEKCFRRDLYYRLSIIPITIPPLRKRISDLDELMVHFINKYSIKLSKTIKGAKQDFIKSLKEYPWPGNVRELENAIEYAVNVETSIYLTRQSLLPKIKNYKIKTITGSLKDQLAAKEREIITTHLKRHKNKKDGIEKMAAELGISRASIYRKLKKIKEP